MVKAFNEREREIIYDLLIEKARELFGLYGVTKTSISDLTRAAGIAQGSFYNFFNSKEELYFKILEIEEQRLKSELMSRNILSGEITAEEFKEFFLNSFKLVDKSPILKRMLVDDEYQVLLRKLPQDVIDEHIKGDEDVLTPLIKLWQGQGIMLQKRPEVIVGLLRSVFIMFLHKKEIGEDIYDETVELLIDLISKGLIRG